MNNEQYRSLNVEKRIAYWQDYLYGLKSFQATEREDLSPAQWAGLENEVAKVSYVLAMKRGSVHMLVGSKMNDDDTSENLIQPGLHHPRYNIYQRESRGVRQVAPYPLVGDTQ